ncbi:hypothetical protein B9Z55_012341 [Caenorhabditis nigoni]|uniref:F-box domain-containing protein n=1 Tax=Caenorhabditis nigoni TaxID=1611254 RepID=A0A2G5TWU9_9PELO|nr:hypothetical protein B9Z55_012341 [Caenorhabditis nigoni]
MSVYEIEMALLRRFGQLEIRKKSLKKRFPLLKLPKIVLLECIENLDVLEIILFSLLSKRAKTIAKLICWSPLDIRLKFNETPRICLEFPTDPDRKWIIDYKTNEKSSHYVFEASRSRVCRRFVPKDNGNATEDSKQMIEHICELFRSPIREVQIAEQSLIEWIINYQHEIRYVYINNNVITSIETLDGILKNLKVTECFHLGSIKTDETIQIMEPIPSRSIIVWSSHWITLPSILNGNNSVIRLFGSKLTPKDIKTILKEWQKGTKLQHLEFLGINISTTLYPNRCAYEVLKDLNLTESDDNDGRPRTVKFHDEWIYQVPQGHQSSFLFSQNVLNPLTLIEWITNFQSTIPYVWIKDDVITSVERLDRLLKNLKVTERLFLGSTIDDQKFKVTEPIPSRFISIKRSFWFKLPAILNGTNSIILLDDPTFTAKDINTILKEWQKGLKLRNLEYLEIKNVLTFWDHELMADLVYTLSSQNDGRPKKV